MKEIWLVGKNAKPQSIVFDRNATRWERVQEEIPKGQQIQLDGRPVIIED